MSPRPLRNLPQLAGFGLKPEHYADVLAAAERGAPPAWVEVHPQNYFGAGGPPHRWLAAIADHVPLSFHSVGLSLGSVDGVDRDELAALAALCERYQPAMVSDHLSWSNAPDDKFPDLLPVPYSHAALDHFVREVGRVQDRLRRPILIENPSRYLAFAGDDWDEVDFLHELCRRAGCGLLLDINNVEVSAFNLGLDPAAWLGAVDPALVGEVHVAGHSRKDDDMGGTIAIDDHGSPVHDSCWDLLAAFLRRAGSKPVLVEWDSDIPDYATLMGEVAKANALLASESVDA
ncbi:MAG: MNIO family bufferin maturase [Sphingopyxis solisilvae]|uniref:MNIO family bufferin maturase n=1 Tax=Sphingopyxis solisilvae TaxID=1886788 RepID=UPI00403651AC